MRVRPISFLSAICVVTLFLIAPSHRGNAELPQSTQEGRTTAPMDMADATKRIAQLAEGSEYNAAIELAGQLDGRVIFRAFGQLSDPFGRVRHIHRGCRSALLRRLRQLRVSAMAWCDQEKRHNTDCAQE